MPSPHSHRVKRRGLPVWRRLVRQYRVFKASIPRIRRRSMRGTSSAAPHSLALPLSPAAFRRAPCGRPPSTRRPAHVGSQMLGDVRSPRSSLERLPAFSSVRYVAFVLSRELAPQGRGGGRSKGWRTTRFVPTEPRIPLSPGAIPRRRVSPLPPGYALAGGSVAAQGGRLIPSPARACRTQTRCCSMTRSRPHG